MSAVRTAPAGLARAAFAAVLLAGCAVNHRPATTVAQLRADAEAARTIERTTRDSIVARLARAALARDDRTLDVLLLSGGGQHGAFGVGVLRGWRARPADRAGGPPMPRFDLVTGVSTGALQAPFAFLGTPAALDTLAALYRTAATSFAPRFDPWFWLRRTGGVVNTRRYEATLARIVDARLRDSLAVGFRGGRQLLVATTDFDAGTGRTWDLAEALGVGAASDATGDAGLARARDVLYTSTAIPGIFPPRVLDGHVHADGGVMANLLAPLDADDWRALGARLRDAGRTGRLVDTSATMRPVTVRVWAILNLWTHAAPSVTNPSSRRAMARRNGGLAFWTQQPQLVARLTDLAHRVTAEVPELRMEVRYVAVPWALSTEPGADKLFDAAWMRRLDSLGYARAQGAAPWDTVVLTPYAIPGAPARTAARTAARGAPDAPGAWTLTPQGLGPLRVGATTADAATALAAAGAAAGALVLPVRSAPGSTCGYAVWRGGPAGVRVMVLDGRIARLDVDDGRVATAEGLRVGDPAARVRAVHGARLAESPHKYVPGGRYLTVTPGADSASRLVFETDGARVTRVRAGVRPAVDFVEGCG